MKAERFEGFIQLLILIAVAGMAGAGSFTHVHDWTMSVVPPGTGSWLGWVNAVITELVPAAAGIEIRRRKRQHRPVTYPMAILVTDAVTSIGVQLSDARHNLGGSLAFALPALAFLALTKLVLSRARTTTETENLECVQPASNPGAQTQVPASLPPENSARATATTTTFPSVSSPPTPSSSPSVPALTAFPSDGRIQPVPSAQLLASARMIAFSHRQTTGRPVTADQLAARLGVPPALAESLLEHAGETPPAVTSANGTAISGGARP